MAHFSTAGVELGVMDIIGDSKERDALMAMITELELDGRVSFHRFTNRVLPFHSGAGFFALKSISDGIALTLLEAMSAAFPVVATSPGGNPEVIVHEKRGPLVPTRNPATLANSITRALGEPSRAVAIGRDGTDCGECELSIDRAVLASEAPRSRLLSAHGWPSVVAR